MTFPAWSITVLEIEAQLRGLAHGERIRKGMGNQEVLGQRQGGELPLDARLAMR